MTSLNYGTTLQTLGKRILVARLHRKREAKTEIHRVALGCLRADTRKAQEQCAQSTLLELREAEVNQESRWELWVPEFFTTRYANRPATKERYATTWRPILIFIDKHQVLSPEQLTYEHLMRFLEWRQNPDTKGVYRVCRNTAIYEIKVWGTFAGGGQAQVHPGEPSPAPRFDPRQAGRKT